MRESSELDVHPALRHGIIDCPNLIRRHSQVVRQGPAKPLSPVRIWVPPFLVQDKRLFEKLILRALRTGKINFSTGFNFI
jgi:hypothetical protein